MIKKKYCNYLEDCTSPRERTEIRKSGLLVELIRVPFTLYCSRTFCGHSEHLWFSEETIFKKAIPSTVMLFSTKLL